MSRRRAESIEVKEAQGPSEHVRFNPGKPLPSLDLGFFIFRRKLIRDSVSIKKHH